MREQAAMLALSLYTTSILFHHCALLSAGFPLF